jgi:hypothetical protein
VTLLYLPEHVEPALLALDLARKEVAHLRYTHETLFSQTITTHWVVALAVDQEMAEKVDAFVGRFARLQDHIGEKLIPRFAALLGESPKAMLDVLAFAEKMHWLDSSAHFVGARKLRNLLVHEYMSDAALFLDSLLNARDATPTLFKVVSCIDVKAKELGLLG